MRSSSSSEVTVDVVLDRVSFTLSHIEEVVQRLLPLLFKSVPVAVLSENRDDTVHSEVWEISLPKQSFDKLLRLSKESSLIEAWPEARFRLLLVFGLPQFHVSRPPNEFLVDHATELWSTILKLWMLIPPESLLRYLCG